MKSGRCLDCGRPVLSRSRRCQPCSVVENWQSRSRRPTIVIPDDVAVRAYLAGILDGEGCITLRAAPERSVQVAVTNTHEPLIRWLEGFGGTAYSRRYTTRQGERTMFYWQLGARRDVVPFLTAVLPYLRIKGDRAREALARFDYEREAA